MNFLKLMRILPIFTVIKAESEITSGYFERIWVTNQLWAATIFNITPKLDELSLKNCAAICLAENGDLFHKNVTDSKCYIGKTTNENLTFYTPTLTENQDQIYVISGSIKMAVL